MQLHCGRPREPKHGEIRLSTLRDQPRSSMGATLLAEGSLDMVRTASTSAFHEVDHLHPAAVFWGTTRTSSSLSPKMRCSHRD